MGEEVPRVDLQVLVHVAEDVEVDGLVVEFLDYRGEEDSAPDFVYGAEAGEDSG